MKFSRPSNGIRLVRAYLSALAAWGAGSISIFVFLLFISKAIIDGGNRLTAHFLISNLSHRPEDAGIWPALAGSFFVVCVAMLIVTPLGVTTAIYLEEVAAKSSRFAKFISASTENLAGTPSIVFGLVGFAVLVRGLGMGPSVLAGALTLAVVVFPIVTIFTQEALRSIPASLREASTGLGSDPWQTTFHQVLPRAWPRIVTGLLLAASRALGETAPLVVVGAAYYVTTLPHSLAGGYTVLPLQVFNWSSDPRRGFHADAAAATLVLVAILVVMNVVARGIARINYIDRL